jgi:hypothetical protein
MTILWIRQLWVAGESLPSAGREYAATSMAARQQVFPARVEAHCNEATHMQMSQRDPPLRSNWSVPLAPTEMLRRLDVNGRDQDFRLPVIGGFLVCGQSDPSGEPHFVWLTRFQGRQHQIDTSQALR